MQHIYERKRRNKKKKRIAFLSGTMILLGIVLLLYPSVSNYLAVGQQENVIFQYEQSVQKAEKERIQKEWKKAILYNEERKNYNNALNMDGNGVMGYLEIPCIDLRLPVYHGTSEEVLKIGVGHLKQTALPIGGSGNHPVITGHRGLPEAKLFTRLDEMKKGDLFYFYILDKKLIYEVREIQTVLPEEAAKIRPEEEKDLVTLVTCTPYGKNTHRLLVQGERVKDDIIIEEGEGMNEPKRNILPVIILILLVGIFFIIYPHLTNKMYANKVDRQKRIFISECKEKVSKKEMLYRDLTSRNEQLFLDRQKNLSGEKSYRKTAVNLKLYGIENNIIGYISIPKMRIQLPIFLGANEENMKRGAAHLTETSYPIGGKNTNCVIAAHRGYSKAAMFREIEILEIGDLIYVENFREKLTYQVVKMQVIEPSDVKRILIKEGKDMITLLTCHPYRKNTHRYVVFCERV